MSPAIEPQLQVGNENYPPENGRVEVDGCSRTPFWLALPFGFATVDAAVLYTVPTGKRLYIERTVWEVTTGFTGGTSSAIGVSSTDTTANTKGDLLGGTGGDVAATLVSTGNPIKAGTLGGKVGTTANNPAPIVLGAGTSIRFDRIASAFTAGAGIVHVLCSFLPTS